nr:excalibur calcium-binding domain-containing protein [Mycobacterium shinjukuense]
MSAHGTCVYRNCTDAKANGRCNISRDDPAYCPKQDRDNDGLACEC